MPVGDGDGLEKWFRVPEEPDLLPLSSDLLLRSPALSLDPERAPNPARGKTRSLEDGRGKSASPLEPLRPDRTGVIRLQTGGKKKKKLNAGTEDQAVVQLKSSDSRTQHLPPAH